MSKWYGAFDEEVANVCKFTTHIMDSVTCSSCVGTLTNYVTFAITCDSTEEKINLYRETHHKVLKIKLSNVLTFLGDGIWCGNVNIKEEDSLDNLKYIVNEPKVHTGVDSTTNLNNSDLSSATDVKSILMSMISVMLEHPFMI
ncbi:hypothetical protein NQ317_007891 [Molorchus minor]|uniref:Uncharacterized protein n=1 Tax=Molorchus minor TaxID=1323400 RepID=A0ABQ9JTH7_9CUCU|nr:hypothetical protein NQ317_007891 [Molorchus minor]